MEDYFLRHKDPEALQYISYAKHVEPYVVGNEDSWQAVSRDSLAMDKLIIEGRSLVNKTTKDFLKLKYGYQVVRLAHYSKRYQEAVNWYDEYIAGNKAISVLQAMSLALKAGALHHLGKNIEAAYLFSRAFNDSEVRRISNYFGFKWGTGLGYETDLYLALCNNNKERANMIALFTFGDVQNRLASVREIYQLDPGNSVLEVLATREINKMEETYLTQKLARQQGGQEFFFTWADRPADSAMSNQSIQARELAQFLDSMAQDKKISNPALFETGAAYTYLMIQDYPHAKKCIDRAGKMAPGSKVKDQLELTQLLLTINSKQIIDAAFEEEILPSIQWLQQKADVERESAEYPDRQWTLFYRNLMATVLAKKYHAQGDIYKEILVVGAGDRGTQDNESYYSYSAIGFLYSKSVSRDVEKLFQLMTGKTRNKFEDYLVNYNSIKIPGVIGFIGTAYLRDYNFAKAIEWYGKDTTAGNATITTDPFIELLYDQQAQLPGEQIAVTKMAFAKEMLRLESLVKSDLLRASKFYYKMALGFYNMTYYGHAWQLTDYGRSGVDGYRIPEDATSFHKEYYGCFRAHDYFKKAMAAATDKNFKAKCLFMMAKCAQKQVQQPQYSDYGYGSDAYNVAAKKYDREFTENKYFPQFIREYKNTAFYNEAFNSCSYLRDFVKSRR